MFGPFSLQHESDSEVDVKVTNIKILDETVKIKFACHCKYLPYNFFHSMMGRKHD